MDHPAIPQSIAIANNIHPAAGRRPGLPWETWHVSTEPRSGTKVQNCLRSFFACFVRKQPTV